MSQRFRKNPAFEKEIAATPQFQAGMRARTTAIAVVVKEGAPRKTGYYRRSIGASGTAVTTSDRFWHLIEFGSVNNPPYSPMRRGVLTAGLRFIPH